MRSDRRRGVKYYTLPGTNLVLKPNKAGDFLEDINRSKVWLDGFENTTGYTEGFTIKENRLWYSGYDFYNEQKSLWLNMPQPTKWTTGDLISCDIEEKTISMKGWGYIEEEEKLKVTKKKRKKKVKKSNQQGKIDLGE